MSLSFLRRLVARWPYMLLALVAAAIVHICATFVMPYFYPNNAYARLARSLPANTFVILPPAQPKAQVLPFQSPDARYAICRYDVSRGPVAVKAMLPDPGWTLSLVSAAGEGFYALPVQDNRRVNLELLIVPQGERFLGPVVEARSTDAERPQLASPTSSGLAVLRAPLRGRVFAPEVERDLAQTTCRAQGFGVR